MHFHYRTNGTCSTDIDFDIRDGKVYDVIYTNGCNGNLQGIGKLVEGMDIDEVITRLKGIACGFKTTSCPDQLAEALEQAKKKLSA